MILWSLVFKEYLATKILCTWEQEEMFVMTVVRGLLVTAGTQCIMSFLCRFLGLKLVAIVDCRCDPSRKAVEIV